MNYTKLRSPHQRFNPGLAKGIIRAIKLYSGNNILRLIPLWRRSFIFYQANRMRAKIFQQEKILVPPFLILSVTQKCDLACIGCYSRDYPQCNELSLEEIDNLFYQAEALGVGFFVITGGEPLIKTGLMEVLARHDRINFFLFTNGSFHDQTWTEQIYKYKHIVPLLSIEGNREHTDQRRGEGVHEKVLESMKRLKMYHAFFGFSAMVSKTNIHILGEESFWDAMIDQGCRIGYFVNYVPSRQKDFSLVPSPEEQAWFREQVQRLKPKKKIIIIHMPDDEYDNGGVCMAAGRGFLHINAQGYAEPCPFAHIATDNIRDKSLKEVLGSSLFAYIRQHPKLLEKPVLGCALFQNRSHLLEIADQVGAKSTEIFKNANEHEFEIENKSAHLLS